MATQAPPAVSWSAHSDAAPGLLDPELVRLSARDRDRGLCDILRPDLRQAIEQIDLQLDRLGGLKYVLHWVVPL